MSDELVFFAEEDPEDSEAQVISSKPWKILIVDDDGEVHHATSFSLKGLSFMHRPLEFLHAYSAAEATQILQDEPEIAVILLDVVMENDRAGLDLVRTIREELELSNIRIVLRTGQPGYAPEMEVIQQYDINDYKNKADLTRTGLFTCVTSALRSYSQLATITTSKKGLEVIVRASSELMSMHGIQELANGIITQLAAVLGIPAEGLICFRNKNKEAQLTYAPEDFVVVAASDQLQNSINTQVSKVQNTQVRELLVDSISRQANSQSDNACTLYFPNGYGDDMLLYLDIQRSLEETEQQLLEVFCSNIAICLDNVTILDRLHNYAYYDSLLDIPNRVSFAKHIDEVMEEEFKNLIIILVDIDHFSGINDTLGAESGDELLRLVAQRLIQDLPAEVFTSRLSGDTFGLMGPTQVLTPELIDRILSQPFELFGNEQMISITQGYYVLQDANISGNNAIKRANIALKRAKDIVRGDCIEYTREIEEETHQRMLLLQGLRKAHTDQELFLAYQPQIDLQSGKIIGVEALMRWRTKNNSMIPPDQFIPVAESSGLIVPLGEWAIKTALQDLTTLEKRFQLGLQMGVNISAVQFRHPNFLKMVQSCLAASPIKSGQVEFEVTESVAMMETENVREILHELHNLGVKVAIDDFGTGFSCLSYLEKLPFDRLKIDKSFIDKMIDPTSTTYIPEMIINLGRSLQMSVIAEGVETEEQTQCLKDLNCFQAQGYFFCRPMELEQLEQWLLQHTRR
ncbi:EAL domain-containing protein [Neptuniibacter sp.]|uniref:bifunctional diguanylate cyclase/phosphodiesterase n=1 Tax=Neptuniibacter sp. TaxID=1962643 RepID=UPI00261025A6|nr:EAL domain-containing protein [Neptuniibacter sp.]MCP4598019.1 EAL domain-containing protein [Neptuniibacter sp.]